MEKFLKSIFTVTAIMCFMASFAFAAPKDELDALYKDMNKVNNGKINIEVNGKFMEDVFNGVVTLKFESKPSALIRGETKFTVYDNGDVKKAKNTAYEFYVEDEGKAYTYYYTEKGKNKWFKDTVSNDDKKAEKDAAESVMSNLDPNVLGDLTTKVDYDTSYTGQAGKADTVGYKVSVDVPKFVEIFSAIALEKATKEDAEKIKMAQEIGKDLPNIDYTVIGDTKKREVTGFVLPLTPFIQGSGAAIAKNAKLDAMTKAIAVMMFSGAELDIKGVGTDYNNVKVEKLPDNIKKSAKQAENKKANKK